MLVQLLDDLTAEHRELAAMVRTTDLDLRVAAEPWDVRDTVSHLLVGNAKGLLAAADPEAFTAELPQVIADPQAYIDGWLAAGRGLERQELVAAWDVGFTMIVLFILG